MMDENATLDGTVHQVVGSRDVNGVIGTIVAHSPTRFSRPVTYDEPSSAVPVGVIVPFDFDLDWEYWRYLPEGIELYFTRTPHVPKRVGVPMARDVGRPDVVRQSARALLSLDPSVMLYACSSGSFVDGVAGERRLVEAMLQAGARRAVTASGAMRDALVSCGIERVTVATPYNRALTARLVGFLEESGFEVLGSHYLDLSSRMAAVSQRTIGELLREAHHPRAEATFVSCTALRTHGIVASLEEEIGHPVFTANQTALWAAIKASRPLALAPDHPGWVIGGGQPMAKSTALLIDAATREAEEADAPGGGSTGAARVS